MVTSAGLQPGTAEGRLKELGITLPAPPTPLGTYVEAAQTGNLLFLSGMLPVIDHKPTHLGKLGKELDTAAGYDAARNAALAALATARQFLGSLDRVARVVRLSVFIAVHRDFLEHPKVADGASDLLRDIFGTDKLPVRSVTGIASLPLGVPVEVEVIFEITG